MPVRYRKYLQNSTYIEVCIYVELGEGEVWLKSPKVGGMERTIASAPLNYALKYGVLPSYGKGYGHEADVVLSDNNLRFLKLLAEHHYIPLGGADGTVCGSSCIHG